MKLRFALSAALLGSAPSVYGWGAAGHEIVATIAQIYLHPKVLPTLCGVMGIEPTSPSCHLASIATWADRVRNLPGWRWSASLHYVGAKDDFPSQTCAFPGDAGWAGREGINVLGGVRNVTGILEEYVTRENPGEPDGLADEALKFLVHFVGDMHMPLHLTGRERGGNGIKVRFGGRITNLHSLWDSRLIAQALRTIPRNYTQPLPLSYVEDHLRGTIYDPYIRRVVWEGLVHDGTWEPEIPQWLSCPSPHGVAKSEERQKVMGSASKAQEEGTDDETVCPYHWASEIHPLNCEIIWPKELDNPARLALARTDSENESHNCHHSDIESVDDVEDEDGWLLVRPPHPPHQDPYIELDTPEYAGVIAKRRIIERLMAQGGIRLAGILNYLFVKPEELIGGQRKLWVDLKF